MDVVFLLFSGQLGGSISVYNEIVDQCKTSSIKAQNTEINNAAELLHIFLNSSKDLIFYKDENGRNIIANNQLADFFGKQVFEVIGETDFEFMPFEIAERCRETDRRQKTTAELRSF